MLFTVVVSFVSTVDAWLKDNRVSSVQLPESAGVQILDILQHSTVQLPASMIKAGDMFVSTDVSHGGLNLGVWQL